MGTKHKNLMPRILDPENLRLAYSRARSGKRMSTGHLLFKEHQESNLMAIRAMLEAGTYRVSPYASFRIFEPKEREIMALPFFDRVIQHALVNIVGPIFEGIFLPCSYACRDGRGTHAAVIEAQATMRRLIREDRGPVWCLKMDFSKYFASIARAVLHREIQRKVSCGPTLRLIEEITPVTGRGLPIGNLTSQLWANLYGHIWDRWLVHDLRIRNIFRYMDDTIILSHDREALARLKNEASQFLSDVLKLRFSKWSLTPVERGIPFLGFRIWPGYKLLKPDSVRRARRKITHFRKYGDDVALDRFVSAWSGHAGWADTRNLMVKLGVAA